MHMRETGGPGDHENMSVSPIVLIKSYELVKL